jgi:hypothetical protein
MHATISALERWLLLIAGGSLVAAGLDSPIPGPERVGVHGNRSSQATLPWVSWTGDHLAAFLRRQEAVVKT